MDGDSCFFIAKLCAHFVCEKCKAKCEFFFYVYILLRCYVQIYMCTFTVPQQGGWVYPMAGLEHWTAEKGKKTGFQMHRGYDRGQVSQKSYDLCLALYHKIVLLLLINVYIACNTIMHGSIDHSQQFLVCRPCLQCMHKVQPMQHQILYTTLWYLYITDTKSMIATTLSECTTIQGSDDGFTRHIKWFLRCLPLSYPLCI